jgi:phosphatidylinositol alpha 1,6-mannosyltransferase
MTPPPRVAFLPDSYAEVNGLALTSRALHRYARSHQLPFLCVRASAGDGDAAPEPAEDELVLPRSRLGIPVESDLSWDPLFWRHRPRLLASLRAFRPDVVHVTGVNDMGQLGAWVAWRLGVPLVASWHTNVHEYAARRAVRWSSWLPAAGRNALARNLEAGVLHAVLRFYRLADAVLAPNEELVQVLAQRTGKPAFLMQRGVDCDWFTPERRGAEHDGIFRVGYVGRLSPEKNVRQLAAVRDVLRATTQHPCRFVVIGDGSERAWLARELRDADLPGVLTGDALASAYAGLDAFIFPSTTDTFGNVVLEAMASGVPVIVTARGGPRWLVEHGVSGFVTDDTQQMAEAIRQLMDDPDRLRTMRLAARERACEASWDRVFNRLYEVYASVVRARKPEASPLQ